jgi:hypothetical protein
MPQQTFDPSSKWLLEHHGASVLYLGGARSVVSCRARKAELVQPRKLPDGLLEARFAGASQPSLILVEVATYPEERVVRQVQGGIRLVRQVYGVLPEALVLCLCRRGRYRVPGQAEETSRLGWTGERLSWKVVELWRLSAEELLAAPGVGLAPWATLARYGGPPEVLLQRCRDRIERDGGEQKADLLAVAQVFARLNFDRPAWLDILGGAKVMIESPLIQEIGAEFARARQVKDIIEFLKARFDTVSADIKAGLEQVRGEQKLTRLLRHAAKCRSPQAFEELLREELPAPPASPRGRRRARKAEGGGSTAREEAPE